MNLTKRDMKLFPLCDISYYVTPLTGTHERMYLYNVYSSNTLFHSCNMLYLGIFVVSHSKYDGERLMNVTKRDMKIFRHVTFSLYHVTPAS